MVGWMYALRWFVSYVACVNDLRTPCGHRPCALRSTSVRVFSVAHGGRQARDLLFVHFVVHHFRKFLCSSSKIDERVIDYPPNMCAFGYAV